MTLLILKDNLALLKKLPMDDLWMTWMSNRQHWSNIPLFSILLDPESSAIYVLPLLTLMELMMLSVTASEVQKWLTTKPECLSQGPVVPKRDVLKAYNKWARNRRTITCSTYSMGIAIKALFPGVRSIQVKRGSDVYRAYVFPAIQIPDDAEELL